MDYYSVPDEVIKAYMEPHRRYHTLEHIYNGLRVFDALCDSEHIDFYERRNIHMAWWLHDAVYDPRSKTNEVDSRELGFKLGVSGEAANLVLSTIYPHSGSKELTRSERVLIDMDLFGLSQLPVIFDHHSEQVRREFNHLSTDEFNTGRLKFWKSLTEKQNPIFQTSFGRKNWEKSAQENIAREIANLELLKVPEKGDVVYLYEGEHCTGGMAVVKAVYTAGLDNYLISTWSNPYSSYGWNHLKALQKELKEKYGNSISHPKI